MVNVFRRYFFEGKAKGNHFGRCFIEEDLRGDSFRGYFFEG